MDREPGSTLPLAEQFRFDGGTPGLDLLATLGFRGADPLERLTSARRFREWLRLRGLPVVAVKDADLETVRDLREDGYAVLAAVAGGQRPPARAVAALNAWAQRPLPGEGIRIHGGTLERRPPAATLETVLVGLARDLVEVALDRTDELRTCVAPACTMVYLDTSRGHRRQWCSMARCGNRAKAARHRARSAS